MSDEGLKSAPIIERLQKNPVAWEQGLYVPYGFAAKKRGSPPEHISRIANMGGDVGT